MAALANYYIDINEFKKAENLLDKAIKINPNYPESYNNRGVLFFRKGLYKSALENYNTAIRLDSSFALAYSNRGTARYYNQDIANASKLDVRLAINDFNKALQLEPDLEVALKNRGFAYRLLGEIDSSMTDYNTYIMKNPRSENGYIERGRLKMELKNYKSALEDFMTALEVKPDAALAYYERANAKSKLKYYEAAIEDYIKAMAYNPQFTSNSLYKIAGNYALLNNKVLSLKFLKQCLANKFFEDRKRLEYFIADTDFDNLKKDADFIALKEKAKKQAKR
jgi:tetratricopeptide (TPR) repeat protein